jgi:hypothetical protein
MMDVGILTFVSIMGVLALILLDVLFAGLIKFADRRDKLPKLFFSKLGSLLMGKRKYVIEDNTRFYGYYWMSDTTRRSTYTMEEAKAELVFARRDKSGYEIVERSTLLVGWSVPLILSCTLPLAVKIAITIPFVVLVGACIVAFPFLLRALFDGKKAVTKLKTQITEHINDEEGH